MVNSCYNPYLNFVIRQSHHQHIIVGMNFSVMDCCACDIIFVENLISIRIITYQNIIWRSEITISLAYFHRCICDFHGIKRKLVYLPGFEGYYCLRKVENSVHYFSLRPVISARRVKKRKRSSKRRYLVVCIADDQIFIISEAYDNPQSLHILVIYRVCGKTEADNSLGCLWKHMLNRHSAYVMMVDYQKALPNTFCLLFHLPAKRDTQSLCLTKSGPVSFKNTYNSSSDQIGTCCRRNVRRQHFNIHRWSANYRSDVASSARGKLCFVIEQASIWTRIHPVFDVASRGSYG